MTVSDVWEHIRVRWMRPEPSLTIPTQLGGQTISLATQVVEPRRSAHIAGRVLISELLAELAPQASHVLTVRCAFCGGEHGPPRALDAGVVLSVSYSPLWVAVAAAPASVARSIGIDIAQVTDPAAPLADLAALFSPRSAPSAREWCRIEAALKADGRGLQVAPNEVEVATNQVVVPGRQPMPVREFDGPQETLTSVVMDPSVGAVTESQP